MSEQRQMKIEPCQWTEEIEPFIASALKVPVSIIKSQVENGATLFRAMFDGELIGAYVLRIDENAEGLEGVVVAAGGNWCGVDLIEALLPVMEMQLADAGVRLFRIHTARPGMVKKLQGFGYQPQEIVFSKRAA